MLLGVAVEFSGNGLRTKHTLWALLNLIHWWETKKDSHYAETQLLIRQGPTFLGVGRISFKQREGHESSPGDAGVAVSKRDSTTEEADSLRSLTQPANMAALDPNATTTTTATTVDDLGDRITIGADLYEPLTRVCTPVQFYSTLLLLLTNLAELDRNAGIRGRDRYFDGPNEDYTFQIGATSQGAAEEGRLTVGVTIKAILTISDWMTREKSGLKFMAFKGAVQRDRVRVANFRMFKGRVPPDVKGEGGV